MVILNHLDYISCMHASNAFLLYIICIIQALEFLLCTLHFKWL